MPADDYIYVNPYSPADAAQLTRREKEILELVIVQGMSAKDAAVKLEVSHRTVHFHTASLYVQLGKGTPSGVHNRIQAYRRAMALGLIGR